jgi:hypothetical protein
VIQRKNCRDGSRHRILLRDLSHMVPRLLWNRLLHLDLRLCPNPPVLSMNLLLGEVGGWLGLPSCTPPPPPNTKEFFFCLILLNNMISGLFS